MGSSPSLGDVLAGLRKSLGLAASVSTPPRDCVLKTAQSKRVDKVDAFIGGPDVGPLSALGLKPRKPQVSIVHLQPLVPTRDFPHYSHTEVLQFAA